MNETHDEASTQGESEAFSLRTYGRSALALMRAKLTARLRPNDEELSSQVSWQQRQLALTAHSCQEAGIEVPEARLGAIFGLDRVELLTLWLASLPWISGDIQPLLQDITGRTWVTLELARTLFAGDEREETVLWLSGRANGNLRRSGLVNLLSRDGDTNPLHMEIAPSEDVLGMFQGLRQLSAALQPYGRWVEPAMRLKNVVVDQRIRRELYPLFSGFWRNSTRADAKRQSPGGLDQPLGFCVVVEGEDGAGKTTGLKALAGSLDRAAIVVDGESLGGASRSEMRAALQAVVRESALFSELVIFKHAESVVSAKNDAIPMLMDLLRDFPATLAFCLRPGVKVHRSLEPSIIWRAEVRPPHERKKRARVWSSHWGKRWRLATASGDRKPSFSRFDAKHPLDPLQVGRAVRASALLGSGGDGPLLIPEHALEEAARNQVRSDLGELAEPMRAERGLDALVLDPEIKQRVKDVILAARNRDQVLHDWQLHSTVRTGLGLCCLFDGEPGTGKTLSAEVVAHELGLQLMRINTSQLFDKYIGETEKNLERVFSRARPSTHLLLFDEADALFSKRTTVKGSNDRYSNMNVGVLLQLVEGYEGVVVLTTNLKQNIDKAFERRIMFKISFPVPGLTEREALWRLLLPKDIPTAAPIDFEALSEVELSGGEIKNAVMHAAYTAARNNALLDTEVILNAAWRGVADSGRLIRQHGEWPEE